MFGAAGRFRLQVKPVHEMREAGLVIRIVDEYLTIGQETEPRPPILATNVYRKEADGWRIVLHHASPLKVGGAPADATPPVVLH
jgi:ketosteroid isomerase-like protein